LIDRRFTRDAFESLASPVERKLLAGELGDEIRALIASIPTADGAVSSILSRLRLVGHHLYPRGDGLFSGEPDVPTGLTLRFAPDGVEVRYLSATTS
jgi:hypothetical protein